VRTIFFSSKIGASSAWILAACTQIKTQHGVLTIKARNESKAKNSARWRNFCDVFWIRKAPTNQGTKTPIKNLTTNLKIISTLLDFGIDLLATGNEATNQCTILAGTYFVENFLTFQTYRTFLALILFFSYMTWAAYRGDKNYFRCGIRCAVASHSNWTC